MNIFTPSWHTGFTILAITLPVLGAIFGGAAYYVDKNLPIKYKKSAEIHSQLNKLLSPKAENDDLWRASEYFKAIQLDLLAESHQKEISSILLSNLDNKKKFYTPLMELAYRIPSLENDELFKAIVENSSSNNSFIHYTLPYLLKREKRELNYLLILLIHHPTHTDPRTTRFKLIDFLSTSVHLSNASNSTAVALANNQKVIDELIKIQDDWFEKYEEWRNINLYNDEHAFDIDKIIQSTYLAKKIEPLRKQVKETNVSL